MLQCTDTSRTSDNGPFLPVVLHLRASVHKTAFLNSSLLHFMEAIGKSMYSFCLQYFLLQVTLFSSLSILQISSRKTSAGFEIWNIELVIGSFYHAVRSMCGVIDSRCPEVCYTKR